MPKFDDLCRLARAVENDIVSTLMSGFPASPSPASSAQAEELIRRYYDASNIHPPEDIIWCSSPMALLCAQRCHDVWRTGMEGQVTTRSVTPLDALQSVREGLNSDLGDDFWEEAALIQHRARCYEGLERTLNRENLYLHDASRVISHDSIESIKWRAFQNSIFRDEASGGRSRQAPHGRSIEGYLSRAAPGVKFHLLLCNSYNIEFHRDTLTLLQLVHKAAGLSTPALEAALDLSRHVGWISDYCGVCWVTPRSTAAKFDRRGRLHNETGPALAYEGAWRAWSISGNDVPRAVIEEPSKITVQMIEKMPNAEVRRLMVARYPGNYLSDCGGDMVAEDRLGKLYRKPRRFDADIVFVRVVNSTREPDGTFREYFLRVPTWIRTPTEAIAWSFDMTVEQYLRTQAMT